MTESKCGINTGSCLIHILYSTKKIDYTGKRGQKVQLYEVFEGGGGFRFMRARRFKCMKGGGGRRFRFMGGRVQVYGREGVQVYEGWRGTFWITIFP